MIWDKKLTIEDVEIERLRDDIVDIKNSHYRHEKEQASWQLNINEKLAVCPLEKAIRQKELEQNGKLDRLTVSSNKLGAEVATTRGQVRLWCYVFTAVLTISTVLVGYFVNKKIQPSDVKDIVIEKTDELSDDIKDIKRILGVND
jgi:hypothetical protein